MCENPKIVSLIIFIAPIAINIGKIQSYSGVHALEQMLLLFCVIGNTWSSSNCFRAEIRRIIRLQVTSNFFYMDRNFNAEKLLEISFFKSMLAKCRCQNTHSNRNKYGIADIRYHLVRAQDNFTRVSRTACSTGQYLILILRGTNHFLLPRQK